MGQKATKVVLPSKNELASLQTLVLTSYKYKKDSKAYIENFFQNDFIDCAKIEISQCQCNELQILLENTTQNRGNYQLFWYDWAFYVLKKNKNTTKLSSITWDQTTYNAEYGIDSDTLFAMLKTFFHDDSVKIFTIKSADSLHFLLVESIVNKAAKELPDLIFSKKSTMASGTFINYTITKSNITPDGPTKIDKFVL